MAKAKRLRRENYPLLLIEWRDSCLQYTRWTFTADLDPKPEPCRIATVGWLVKRRKGSVTVVQCVGGLERGGRAQVVNGITIPTGCIISETVLRQ